MDTPIIKTKKKKAKYIDNDQLFKDMCSWKQKFYKNPDIKLSDELGRAILIITKETAKHPRFSRYTWKEELIEEAIIDCVRYLKNFNEVKYSNVHAYMTMICWNAFFRVNNEETEKQITKYKFFLEEMFSTEHLDSGKIDTDFYLDILSKVTDYDKMMSDKKVKQKAKQKIKDQERLDSLPPEEIEMDLTLDKFVNE